MLQVGTVINTMDSENLSWSEEPEHIEIVVAVHKNRRIWQKFIELSLLQRLVQKKWAIVGRGAT